MQINPDDSSGACACIAGTDWNARGRCCGDDADDCGRISTGVLCSIDANAASAGWILSTQNLGDIRYVGCAGAEYLSDGNNWRKCDGTFWKQAISNSEYMCTGIGRESIVECCGDGACKSRADGKRLSTGQSTVSSGASALNKTYYCMPDRKFATDLDVPDSQASDKALIGKNKATCEKAGFVWTGTKCCSEDDDANEYYSDPNGLGGCWNKKPIASISFVEGTDNSVVNYNGEFHGCAVGKANFNRNNGDLLNLEDTHTGGQLITNHDYCFNDPGNNYYCSYTEKWMPTEGTGKTHVSFAPLKSPRQAAECCAKDDCWDGSQCIANQRSNPLAQPVGNSSRCIDGEWTESQIAFSADGATSGYCPGKTQCLINIFGVNEASQCINSSSYINDNYCENGVWSSRTKLLALKLLKIKSGDFILSCGSKENELNNLQYLTESNDFASNILANLQANNFCILKTQGKIIAGSSINKNLEEIPGSSVSIFGVADCKGGLIDDGQYHSCDNTGKVWFNKRLKSFIYSSASISVPSEQEPTGSFMELVGSQIRNIIDSVKRLISSPPFDESYLRGISKFDKLYMAQQGGKTIKGTIEGADFKNAVIEYAGFEDDLCGFFDKYNQAKKDVSSGISCKKEGNAYYVLAQGSRLTNVNPESIWPDLTSKLRLR